MTIYHPDKWVVLELIQSGEVTKKVLGSWYGGFAGSDSYRLSSGITKILDKEDYYEIHNYSGSIYVCYKDQKGMSLFTASVLENWKKRLERTTIRVLDVI